MKIIIRPVVDPQQEVALTRQLVLAIAEELWRVYGGNEQLNWLEAERHLEGIVADARSEAAETALVLVDAELAGVTSDVPARRSEVEGAADGNGRRNVRVRRPLVRLAAVAVCVTA